jgi:DNA-binding beta-propeller fold protein YncE
MRRNEGLLVVAAAVVIGCAIAAGPAVAQTTPYYITDGDATTMYVIQNGALQATHTILPMGDAIAIRNTMWIASWQDDASAEYTLAGAATGATHTLPATYTQLLDGTTDGVQYNYASQWNGSAPNVIRADPEWQNQQVLFSLTSGTMITGITYDPTTSHLFLAVETDNTVREFDLSGNQLNSFSVSAVSGRPCCLAYEAATNTLWLSANGSSNIYQFSKAGSLQRTLTIANFPSVGAENTWGGEMQVGSAQAIPAAGAAALALFGLLVVGLGALFLIRKA